MIYIVRHGQTDYNVESRYGGRIDIDINSKGIEQAYETKEKLRGIKFDRIISSPLTRALHTARIITNNNPNIEIDERIIERDNGDLEGRLKTDINRELKQRNEPPIDFNDPNERRYNIENILDFRNRIYRFLNSIIKNYNGENILIVTHAGVGLYMRCYFEGEPPKKDYSVYKLNNGEFLRYNVPAVTKEEENLSIVKKRR